MLVGVWHYREIDPGQLGQWVESTGGREEADKMMNRWAALILAAVGIALSAVAPLLLSLADRSRVFWVLGIVAGAAAATLVLTVVVALAVVMGAR